MEWADPPADLLGEYVLPAMQLLKNAGIVAEGVTSPGGFGGRKEPEYAKAILDAAMTVYQNPRPFYFLRLNTSAMSDIPLWHVQKDKGIAIASVIGCAGDWFGGTGWGEASADLFITADLRGGRCPQVIERELPCVLVGHWPCFYANAQIGFKVLKEVKRRGRRN